MIPAGTLVGFVLQGNVSTWSPVEMDPANLRERFIVAMQQRQLTPYNVSVLPTTAVLGGLLEYSFQARVTVSSPSSHSQPMDIGRIVADAVYSVTGKMPTVIEASNPLAPPEPDPDTGNPFAWLQNFAKGVGLTVGAVAVAAVVIGVVVLRER